MCVCVCVVRAVVCVVCVCVCVCCESRCVCVLCVCVRAHMGICNLIPKPAWSEDETKLYVCLGKCG